MKFPSVSQDDFQNILYRVPAGWTRLTPWITPEQFGAQANGSFDDAVAINMAIKYLVSTSGGGVIMFGAKQYYLFTPINMSSSVTLQGQGGASTMGSSSFATTLNIGFIGAGIQAVPNTFFMAVRDMNIVGGTGGGAPTTGRHGIVLSGTQAQGAIIGFLIDNVRFFKVDNAVKMYDTSGSAQMQISQVSFVRSKTDQVNIGIYQDSSNSELYTEFSYINFLDVGIEMNRSGQTVVNTCFGGAAAGTGRQAFVYNDQTGRLTMINSQAESVLYHLFVPNTAISDPGRAITLIGNTIDAPVVIHVQRSVVSIGNRYDNNTTSLALTNGILTSINDYPLVPFNLTQDSGGAWATIINSANPTVQPDGFFQSTPEAAVASATTITPTGTKFHVTGTNAIATINLPWPGFAGQLALIPDAAFTTTAAGNIAKASTAVIGQVLYMTYDYNAGKWYPSY